MVERGVPIHDCVGPDVVWVYYPKEEWDDGKTRGWVCDVMWIRHGSVGALRDQKFSNRYLASMDVSR